MYSLRNHIVVVFLLVSATLPQAVNADVDTATGNPPPALEATVNLDFKIVIPGVLRFRVGTNAAGSPDLITFTQPAATLGDGSDTAGTGGDAGGGSVNVSLVSNIGAVTITEDNNSTGAGLGNGNGDFIPYTEILTNSSNTNLTAPTLSDDGGGTSSPTPTNGNVTNENAVWTYLYDNSTAYPPGDYGADTGGGGGRVTYTAAAP